jgi:hypothetical protein
MVPEIQRDKRQDKDKYARPRFSNSPIECRLQVITVEISKYNRRSQFLDNSQ